MEHQETNAKHTSVDAIKHLIEVTLNKRNLPVDKPMFKYCESLDQVNLINARLQDKFGRLFKRMEPIDSIQDISRMYTWLVTDFKTLNKPQQ